MQFTTKITIPKSNYPIDYDSKIMSLGSCFAVNMAEKLTSSKFQNTVNLFGILFHPLAIQEIIRRAVQHDLYTETDVFFHNERWHCFDTHSDLSNSSKDNLLQNLNEKLSNLKTQIESASHLLITYGTAWVYREKATQKIVANCHKVPQSQFEKELLSIATIEKAIQETIATIQSVNPKANIVFTVSPVRHLKDGFVENQRGKSHLIAAIHKIINYQLSLVNYFPSYEIMMDELRDYRFYTEDMIHPNQIAVDYIWEQFVSASFDSKCHPIMQEVESIQKALAHRPFNPNSESHLKFKEQLQARIKELQQDFPHIHF